MPTTLTAAIDHFAKRQHGLVTRDDLEVVGVTDARRRRLVRSGSLERVGSRTFRTLGSPRTALQIVMLACLDLRAKASHQTSGALHRVDPFELIGLPDVIVRRGGSTRSDLARLHTTTNLGPEDIVVVQGIPALSLARTLITLAAQVPPIQLDVVRNAVDVAVRDGRATDAWLWSRLEALRCRGRNGVTVFAQVLEERMDGATESWLERETLRLIDAAGLPRPVAQVDVRRDGRFVARVDFMYEAQRVVVEVSGHATHSTRAQRAADARRRNQLQLAGYRILEFTFEDVVRRPQLVTASIAQALAMPIAG